MTDPASNTDELEPEEEATVPSEGQPDDENAAGAADTEADAEAVNEAADMESAAQEAEHADGGVPAPGPGEGASPAAELAELKEDFDALNDRHLRLAAEFNNYRRRLEQERLDLWGRAQADLLAKLLDVLDDLQRVADLDLESATVDGIMEGIDLVERKFARVLDDAGVEVVDPLGEVFDPEVMEAMMREPAESEEDEDRVARVLQKGYKLKGVLVRPARVSVHKHG
ncbi:MAG: nucleotide exchange factor GrpE [Gemmatimonadetes bacterium]|nr:nucleotide exchange factor GrpE [Gemmatimonadota bacterium]